MTVECLGKREVGDDENDGMDSGVNASSSTCGRCMRSVEWPPECRGPIEYPTKTLSCRRKPCKCCSRKAAVKERARQSSECIISHLQLAQTANQTLEGTCLCDGVCAVYLEGNLVY